MSRPANPELRERILELALEELAEKPPEKINMRDLASRAGVSATAIYYYFPSKGDLFLAISKEAMGELEARVEDAIQARSAESATARLGALMREFLAWCAEKPQAAKLLMEALPARPDLSEEEMRPLYAMHNRARSLLEEAVRGGEQADRDLDLDISLAQAALWGIVSQVLAKRIHPRFWEAPEPLAERLFQLMFGNGGMQ